MNVHKKTLATIGILSAALGLVLLPACGKQEDPFEKGQAAYDAGDYQTAAAQFKLAADKGNAEAMYRLGLCYHDGQGVEKDANEAVKWYQNAVKGGNTEAQAYLDSLTSVIDEVKSLTEAAEKGDADAMRTVAYAYLTGSGVKPSDEEAAKWFRKAAENGNSRAMLDIGLCYEDGVGVEKDPKEAFRWYRMAADKGLAYAELNWCYKEGFGVEKDEAEAEKWYALYEEKEKQNHPAVSESEKKNEDASNPNRNPKKYTGRLVSDEALYFSLIRNMHTSEWRDVLVK